MDAQSGGFLYAKRLIKTFSPLKKVILKLAESLKDEPFLGIALSKNYEGSRKLDLLGSLYLDDYSLSNRIQYFIRKSSFIGRNSTINCYFCEPKNNS